MTHPSYLLVSLACLAAVALILLGQTGESRWPGTAASVAVTTAEPAMPPIPQLVTTALEDLAAWPAAAGR
jgi:hypothetical protein